MEVMGGQIGVCIYTYIYVCMCVYIHIHTHTHTHKEWDWVRLIDDTLPVWTSEVRFLEFFQYLNTLHDSVKCTCETENDNKLAIFDILIIYKSEQKVDIKQQSTGNQQLQIDTFTSHRP